MKKCKCVYKSTLETLFNKTFIYGELYYYRKNDELELYDKPNKIINISTNRDLSGHTLSELTLQEWLDSKYTKEEQLGLTSFSCASLKRLEKLTNLEYLDCSHNPLTSLKGIENLDKLEDLYFLNKTLPIYYQHMPHYELRLFLKKEARKLKTNKLLNN